MAEYSYEQSTVVALWVLALGKYPTKSTAAPEIIADVANKLGEPHTAESVLLHKHGYDRLLLGRPIDKTITSLQRRIAKELYDVGVAKTVHDV